MSKRSKSQKTGERSSGQGDITTLREQTESGSSAQTEPDTILRPDLLNYNPTEKSGYLFYGSEGYHNWRMDHKVKMALAKGWHACLKNHPSYKEIMISPTANIHDAFDAMHKVSDKLFKGYSWMIFLDDNDNQKPKFYYYKSLGDIGQHNLPLKWFDDHDSKEFRCIGLWLIKAIGHKFHIGTFSNDIMQYVLEDIDDVEELTLKLAERVDAYGDNTGVSQLKLNESIANHLSYKFGRPRMLQDEMATLKSQENNFHDDALRCSGDNLQMYEWLMSGLKLFQGPSVSIHDFDLSPGDVNCDDGSPVKIDQAIFFPYSFDDEVFGIYEEWIEDMANSIGTNDIWKYGILLEDDHILPSDEKPLLDLIKFLDDGRKLYFSQTPNKHIDKYYYGD